MEMTPQLEARIKIFKSFDTFEKALFDYMMTIAEPHHKDLVAHGCNMHDEPADLADEWIREQYGSHLDAIRKRLSLELTSYISDEMPST